MDFARKQLEKYGWSEGKGLGRHENGIKEPLKPKLKRSTAGVGHDASVEFNDHWWSKLFDEASKNIQVVDKNGKTKKIKTLDPNGIEITSKSWRIKKRKTNSEPETSGYGESFIKKSTLTNGGEALVSHSSESEDEGVKGKDALKMTDEELFAACGGRTAHKGARHGLKALGKLARIEMQEKNLLKLSKYEGYSQSKLQDNSPENSEIKSKKEKTFNPIVFSDENLLEDNLKVIKKKNKKYDLLNEDKTELLSQDNLQDTVEESDYENKSIKKYKKNNKNNSTLALEDKSELSQDKSNLNSQNETEDMSYQDKDSKELMYQDMSKKKNKKNKSKLYLLDDANLNDVDTSQDFLEQDQKYKIKKKKKYKKNTLE